jgi:hypothetical protein
MLAMSSRSCSGGAVMDTNDEDLDTDIVQRYLILSVNSNGSCGPDD